MRYVVEEERATLRQQAAAFLQLAVKHIEHPSVATATAHAQRALLEIVITFKPDVPQTGFHVYEFATRVDARMTAQLSRCLWREYSIHQSVNQDADHINWVRIRWPEDTAL